MRKNNYKLHGYISLAQMKAGEKLTKSLNIKELLKILLNKQKLKETIEGLGLADSFLFWCFSKSHLLRCYDLRKGVRGREVSLELTNGQATALMYHQNFFCFFLARVRVREFLYFLYIFIYF
ncbi:hypothetical protein J0R77_001894 [Campylobacter coli]|nr:hypothetical protein [Campylobacter coli]